MRVRGKSLAPCGMLVLPPNTSEPARRYYYEPILQKDKSIMECGVGWG